VGAAVVGVVIVTVRPLRGAECEISSSIHRTCSALLLNARPLDMHRFPAVLPSQDWCCSYKVTAGFDA
jgi:hypothetical protein